MDAGVRRLPVPVPDQLQRVQPHGHHAAQQSAKLLMGAQATAALLVTLVIIARAVGAIQ